MHSASRTRAQLRSKCGRAMRQDTDARLFTCLPYYTLSVHYRTYAVGVWGRLHRPHTPLIWLLSATVVADSGQKRRILQELRPSKLPAGEATALQIAKSPVAMR